MTDPETIREYGLPPQLRARLMGTFLAVLGVLLLVSTALVGALHLPLDILSGVVILTVISVFVLGSLLVRRWYVVRLDQAGYQVRFVRGAGAASARWNEVEDLATAFHEGAEVVVLRLKDGRTTTIPVALIEGDHQDFVTELHRRLHNRS